MTSGPTFHIIHAAIPISKAKFHLCLDLYVDRHETGR